MHMNTWVLFIISDCLLTTCVVWVSTVYSCNKYELLLQDEDKIFTHNTYIFPTPMTTSYACQLLHLKFPHLPVTVDVPPPSPPHLLWLISAVLFCFCFFPALWLSDFHLVSMPDCLFSCTAPIIQSLSSPVTWLSFLLKPSHEINPSKAINKQLLN